MHYAQQRPKHTAQPAVMQRAYACQMAITSARHLTRQQRLKQLVAEVGGPTALSDLSGTPKTHISALSRGSRGIGDALAEKFALVCGKPANWMDTPVDPSEPGAVAQSMSYRSFILPLTISWEGLMKDELPAVFTLVMLDDSMERSIPRGTELVFERIEPGDRPPEPGDCILVADSLNRPYIRRYVTGAGAHWEAHAANREAYQPLIPERDGLTLLAVLKFRGGSKA